MHVHCTHPGCPYIASRKLVKIHMEEKHPIISSLVPKLDSPDDIARWREERRKRYPSAENVKKKPRYHPHHPHQPSHQPRQPHQPQCRSPKPHPNLSWCAASLPMMPQFHKKSKGRAQMIGGRAEEAAGVEPCHHLGSPNLNKSDE
ncbi:hypothetical protein PAPYR_8302 [Paratrimastix pyriformis]|uniref:FMR1-interacting protein 1 conserved domain-containing protein n=1 Tax=Paratrimastix pyriformis TaxID=342808 RepID=A0ABQ8UAZ6_9EUKA|nr:hypothetical protein PAPYR_8302 [Paratrimastix pyriformis]